MANRTASTPRRIARQDELATLKQLLAESHRPVPAKPPLAEPADSPRRLLTQLMLLIAEGCRP